MHAFNVTFLIMQIVALTLEIVQLSYYSLALWPSVSSECSNTELYGSTHMRTYLNLEF